MEKSLEQKPTDSLKVVLFGPESTGKTSLAEELAHHYNTLYVPEFSRILAETKGAQGMMLTKDDVLPIAVGQMQLENKQAYKCNRLLICDTDLLETEVYAKYYYEGYCPDSVEKYARINHYDLYLLTYIDVPWEADGIRDQPKNRLQMYHMFEQALIDLKRPFVVVKGSFEERLQICKTQIDKLLKQND